MPHPDTDCELTTNGTTLATEGAPAARAQRTGKYIGKCPDCRMVLADFDRNTTSDGVTCPRCNFTGPSIELLVD